MRRQSDLDAATFEGTVEIDVRITESVNSISLNAIELILQSATIALRCDSSFFSKFVVQACREHDVRYSITATQNPVVTRAIESITEDAWTGIDYTVHGEA